MNRWLSWIRGDKGNYFRYSLIISLLITSIPSAFIAISNYMIGIDRIEKEVYRTHQIKFEQFSDTMNKQFDQIALVMSRWSTNPMFDDHLDDLVFIDNIGRMQELMRSLLVVGGSSVIVEEARLYLNNQKTFIGSDGIYRLDDPRQAEFYQSLLSQKNGLFLAYGLSQPARQASAVSVIFKLPWHAENPFGAFVLNLNQAEMKQLIRQIHAEEGGYAYLMRKSGEYVLPPEPGEREFFGHLSDIVLQRKGIPAPFPYPWHGETYLVSYGEVTTAGWVYVSATPLSKLTEPVLQTAHLILASSLIGILTALALAWFASKRLYRPIRRLVQMFKAGKADAAMQDGHVRYEIEFIEQQWGLLTQERQTLQEKLKLSLPSLREGFLLQLVQGHLYALDEAGLKERMEQLGWDVRGKQLSILLVQLSGLNHEIARFKEDDRELISFAAANIADELARQHLHHTSVINFLDMSVGVLCMLPEETDREGVRRMLISFSQEVVATLGKMLGLQATAVISRVTDRVSDIPELFDQARQAWRYRDLLGSRQIIDMEEIVPHSESAVRYPFSLEKEFLHAMRLGLPEESIAKFDEFMAEVQREAGREMLVQHAAFQLLGSVRHMLIELGFGGHSLLAEGRQVEELMAIRETAAIPKWFKQRIIAPYLEEFQRTQHVQSRQLIEKTLAYLQENYMKDVSLEECADAMSTSPFTLSRCFKQVTGVNFVDYIMRLRIEKARELLLGTELKISEVAERVGYQHSYFNKVFKGIVGLTPTQYREQHQKEL